MERWCPSVRSSVKSLNLVWVVLLSVVWLVVLLVISSAKVMAKLQ